jgi:hypothetical protein
MNTLRFRRLLLTDFNCPAELVTFLVGRDEEPFTVHKGKCILAYIIQSADTF